MALTKVTHHLLDGIEAGADVTDSTNVASAMSGFPTGTDAVSTDLIAYYDESSSNWELGTIANVALQGPAGSPDTAADVLTKIKTVDGSGSGLDADTLDGSHASSFITTSATQANSITIRNTNPTLYLRDTNNNSSMLHCNSNLFYVLRGGTDTQTWTQVNGRWPLQINLGNNDATFGGNVTAYSDERLKENIKPIGNSVEMFEKIEAKRFDWIDGGKSDIGFIAQDVQAAGLVEVVKEAEKRDPDTGELQDTNLTLDYSRMVSVLWDVVKELKAEIEELKGAK